MRLRAGELKTRVTILERREGTQDGYGETTPRYAFARKWWAKVEYETGRESSLPAAKTRVATRRAIFTMRYDRALTVEHRIEFDGRTFAIVSIVNVSEENKVHVVETEEVVA